MKVLLTNDDGIRATGLNAMREALLEVDDVELAVIAPDGNRSAMGRSITTRKPLSVEEVDFGDGTTGFATDGTPVDCVRFAALGLIPFQPELIVSGINHGSNLGDDITYSGTVAAALEGIVLGLPAVAVSQQADRGRLDWTAPSRLDRRGLRPGGGLHRRDRGPPRRGAHARGNAAEHQRARGTRRGRRGMPAGQAHLPRPARARPERRTGASATASTATSPGYHEEEGTDFAALSAGRIAVTPLHFDLTDQAGIEALGDFDLEALLRPAAEEV